MPDDTPPAPSLPSLSEIRDTLYSAVISDALDAAGLRQQCLALDLTPMTGIQKMAGRARTTIWENIDFEDPEPYQLELEAVDACQPGEIFVAAAQGSTRSGIWGELLSTAALHRGCAGALIDGAVRDVAAMRAMQFPVFARSRSPYDSLHRQRVIAHQTEVQIGGVTVSPGDLIFADEDGVVIVPQAVEAQVITAAWQKVHAENEVREAIRSGQSATATFKQYGIL